MIWQLESFKVTEPYIEFIYWPSNRAYASGEFTNFYELTIFVIPQTNPAEPFLAVIYYMHTGGMNKDLLRSSDFLTIDLNTRKSSQTFNDSSFSLLDLDPLLDDILQRLAQVLEGHEIRPDQIRG